MAMMRAGEAAAFLKGDGYFVAAVFPLDVGGAPHAAPAGPYCRDTAAPRTLPGGGPWATRARLPRAPVPRAAELRRTALVGLG